MGGVRLGVKNCGRWEIGGQKLWEVGDWGLKIVGGGRLGQKLWEIGTCVTPPPPPPILLWLAGRQPKTMPVPKFL